MDVVRFAAGLPRRCLPFQAHRRSTGQLDDRLGVISDNPHRDRRVKLGLGPDEMLGRDEAALPVGVALWYDALPAPQLDKEVFDAGDRGAKLCLEQDRRLVVGMLPESREEVLPLLDGDADMTPPWLTGRPLGVLPGPSSLAGQQHKDLGWSCTVRRCPGHPTGRFVNVLSTSVFVIVAEVDVIELPVDQDCECSSIFLSRE